MLGYTFTPVQEIHDPILDEYGVRLLVKREDLNHPLVSGNKWWKLKYNLEEAKTQGYTTLLTFGGAFSNHIYATAAAAHELGFKSIGIIRGEETTPLNSTLSFARSRGMQLHFISREQYRLKTEKSFVDDLHKKFGDFYLIPEGGSNNLAVKGVTEFAQLLGNDFDHLCCAVGTGGTIAGLINGISPEKKIIGFPVLKGGEFLKEEIEKLLPGNFNNWNLIADYHFGGYAKTTPELTDFIADFEFKHSIKLDPVYTGKMMYGILQLIQQHYFQKGTRILALHSGGLR